MAFQNRDIHERILRTDKLALALNPEVLGVGAGKRRLVDLACGHKTLTQGLSVATCPRCTEMLRRSIADGSEDYEAFRSGTRSDDMSWTGDQCRLFNEPHDLSGTPLRD